MKISIIGAGCVGGVLAERLVSMGEKNQVSLILSGERAQLYLNNGLIVNGKRVDIPIQVKDDSADLVIICVKNFDLEKACDDLSEYINEKTILLPLLNSISPTPTIQEKFPKNRVLYGYITKIDAFKEGKEYKYNIAGDIHFGYAKNNVVAPELKEIQNIFRKAGFNAYIDEDMIRGVWKKWMLNVGANQVSALTEANYLDFAQIPEIEKILRLAMQELLLIACYEKVNLGTSDIAEIVQYLTTYPFPKKTSMLQDILAKKETEVDYISGDIIKLSNKWHCPCPINLTMYYLIKSKQSVYLLDKGKKENNG